MANVINLKKAFYMEPEEIVKYFESKGLTTSFDWHEVYEDAHARAFTVAKMTQIDLLKDTQNMLSKAIKEGWSEGKFKKNATELFAKNGWTGFKEVTNPNGEKQTVELGTPRRIKKIFQCNMHSAYAAGRYKKQLENADVAPYLQYICVLDGKTRPEHRAMHEKVFRYDDKIWNTMYPPNGWNCRCIVRQLTQSDMKRKGLNVESSEGYLKEITEKVGGEDKTNTVYTFSKGGNVYHLKPDAGWNNNVGKAAYLDDILMNKIEAMPEQVKEHFIKEIADRQDKTVKEVKELFEKTIPIQKAKEMNLSEEDFKAIQEYTNDSSKFNNPIKDVLKDLPQEKIQEMTKDEIYAHLPEETQKQINPLIKAFKNVTATTGENIVFRGEGTGILEQLDIFKDIKGKMADPKNAEDIKIVVEELTGKTVTQHLFMSASVNKNKAKEYALKTGHTANLLWQITVGNKVSIIDTRNISSKKWEEELLFDRGQKLEINEIKYNKRYKIWKIEASLIVSE